MTERGGAGGEGAGAGAAERMQGGSRAEPTWPAAPSRSSSGLIGLHYHGTLPAPAPARKRGPPPARPVPARRALPVASGSACPGRLRPPPGATRRRPFPAVSRARWRWAGASLSPPLAWLQVSWLLRLAAHLPAHSCLPLTLHSQRLPQAPCSFHEAQVTSHLPIPGAAPYLQPSGQILGTTVQPLSHTPPQLANSPVLTSTFKMYIQSPPHFTPLP